MVEIALRIMGYQPGNLKPYWAGFEPLPEGDSLMVYEEYFVDSEGIFKANADYFHNNAGYRELGVKINSEGFRGPEFDEGDSTKPKVLFLGDSFVWGSHAEPISQCFVDLVEADGYQCFNLGIPGTGPVQYAYLAEKYIPTLEPDFVVVGFYIANDVIYERREIVPGQSLYFITNAGWMAAEFGDQTFANAHEAYHTYHDTYFVTKDDNFAARILGKTAIGTLLMAAPKRISEFFEWRRKKREILSLEYLEKIEKVSKNHGAKFLVCVIPDLRHLDRTVEEMYPGLFGKLEYHEPGGLEPSDFHAWPDGHFNNKGHRKFADFVLEVMDRDIAPPLTHP